MKRRRAKKRRLDVSENKRIGRLQDSVGHELNVYSSYSDVRILWLRAGCKVREAAGRDREKAAEANHYHATGWSRV